MKKSLFTLALSFVTVFAFSQIKVTAPNGDVGIGTTTPSEKLEVAGRVLMEDGSVVRSGASASLMFNRTDKSAFIIGAGNRPGMTWDKNFTFELRSNSRGAIVNNRYLSQGLARFNIRGTDGYTGIGAISPAEKLHVGGAIQTDQTFIASDKRLKKSIESFGYGLEEVLQINTKQYKYKKDNDVTKNKNVGVLAQDLQAIAPNLVSTFTWVEEDENGDIVSEEEYLRIDDTAIKWMLVNAIQSQQELIEEKDDRIEDLEERLTNLENIVSQSTLNTSNQSVELNGIGALNQNIPNPFNDETIIEYSVPKGTNYATLAISNASGRTIRTIALEPVSSGSISIKSGDLESGSYSYSLIADGKIVETKKMILTK